MSERLQSFLVTNCADVENALRTHLPMSSLPEARRLNDALDYALFPGGKRLRPALSLLASALVGVPRADALTIACGIEFLHSSSLIIDDLPAMDDAGLRRNRPALHLVFGESTALLAALALLNQSYALFAEAALSCGGAVDRLVSEATRAVGSEGMIGGQMIDLVLKASCTDTQSLAGRDLKTVALMRLMTTAGAIAAGSAEADARALREFGECAGRAYQICDDLLDQCAGNYTSGKTIMQDARHGRASAVSALGFRSARKTATELTDRATSALAARFGQRAEVLLLTDAVQFVVNRVPNETLKEAVRSPAWFEAASVGD